MSDRKFYWKRFMNNTGMLFLITLVGLFAVPAALAQSGAGSIQGTVSDATGAVIPRASIHIVNKATGVAEDTKANKVGFYQVPDLFTGTYVVTITAPGMKTYQRTIDLLATQTGVVSPTMATGAETQTVTVTANAVQLTDSEDGTISSTLDAARMQEIPENTRELLTLAYDSTPGFDSPPNSNAPSTTPGGGDEGQRANGLMEGAVTYVADGVTMTNRGFGGEDNSGQSTLPDPDSIQQVSIKLSNASAQFATPGTAVITTKSGTNSVHGTFFETAVNNAWGIAKTRNDLSNAAAPPYVRNEFGLSAGGPIVLPHIYNGKGKSFWFFAYERYSLASTTENQVKVPTVAMRNGDFSALTDASGDPLTIYDPQTTANNPACVTPLLGKTGGTQIIADTACRTAFPNNQIPLARESPTAKQILDITPLPTNTNSPFVGGTGFGNYTAPDVYYVVVPTITFRLDQNFNENNKAYLRYTSNNQIARSLRVAATSPATIAADGFPAGATGYQNIPVSNFGAALGFTHIFSPSFFSETILSNQWFMQYVGGGGNPNLDYEQMLRLPNNFGETGFPDLAGLITPYGGTMFNYQSNQNITQIDENLTKTFGEHQMFFGGRYHHERLYYLNDRRADEEVFGPYSTGLYDTASGNVGGSYPAAGRSDADFFLGSSAVYYAWLQPPPSWFRDQEVDAYLQDNWHIARSLTLNLGLRYEAHPARETRDGANDALDIKNHAIVLGNSIPNLIKLGYTTQPLVDNMEAIGVNFETAQQAGFPNALYKNALLDFSPRVGYAWQPFENRWGTILRGAYGRYIYPEPTRNANPGPTALPFTYEYGQNYENATQAPGGESGYLLRNPQTIFMGVNSSNVISTAASATTGILPGFTGETFFNPDFKTNTVTELNTTVEQPLRWNSVLRISHVYTHGSNLAHEFNLNAPASTPVWQMQMNEDVPTGTTIGLPTYQTTSRGSWDNTVYGAIDYDERTGWSNDNQLQINFQRLYHHGFGFQVFYVYSKAFRVGGNSTRDSVVYPWENFLGGMQNPNVTMGVPAGSNGVIGPINAPPSPPTNVAPWYEWHKMNVWQEYKRDTGVAPEHLAFNYIVDLPFGRGKKYFNNSNRWINGVIGGYQIAGVGHMVSSIFQPTATNWGAVSKIKLYKHKVPITDCSSGNCYKEYLWFNGYIAPSQIAGNPACTSNCISGLPGDYTAYQTPIDVTPNTTYYNQNEVTVTGSGLNGGSGGSENQVFSEPSAGNPFWKTVIQGPKNWESDISLFKTFPIKGTVSFQFKADIFNFLNHQGYTAPNATTGIETYVAGGVSGASSYNAGRQVQFTGRLSF
jgi:hypothetical protein